MNTFNINDEEPTRKFSTKKYDKIKSIEQTVYDIKYQEKLRRYLCIIDYLKVGLNKAYYTL